MKHDKETAKSRRQTILRHCSKALLLTASYQVFSVFQASGSVPAAPVPGQDNASREAAISQASPGSLSQADAANMSVYLYPECAVNGVCVSGTGCGSCTGCTGCTGCTHCTGSCTGCTGCTHCTGCTGCTHCTSGCTGCTGCTHCTGCTGCTGRTIAKRDQVNEWAHEADALYNAGRYREALPLYLKARKEWKGSWPALDRNIANDEAQIQAAEARARQNQAAREQAARDQAAREQAARVEAARVEAERERVAREQAAQKLAEQEQIRKQIEAEKQQAFKAKADSTFNALIDDVGSGAASTKTIYLNVNGKPEEFTTLEHPHSGPGTAGDQLRGIAGDDKRAAASKLNEGADAKDRLELGFDTPGNPNGSLSPIVLTDNGTQMLASFHGKYPDDTQIKGYQKDLADAVQKYQKLGDDLKAINTKIANNQGSKGELEVSAAKVLDQMAAAKSEAGAAIANAEERVRVLDLGLHITETPSKSEPPPPPSPSPGAAAGEKQPHD
jgi:hypothetical protein